MTKLEGMTNEGMTNQRDRFSSFEVRASFLIGHSWFVISCALLLTLMAQTIQAQSPNMTGNWNIELTFGDGARHSLRFGAQTGGKGTLLLTDPQAKVWGAAKSSEAKWSQGEGNAVTFSGPMEFLLGNVGRDAGTLMFKGKFETPNLITGDVEFSPLVGERPTKHGTFKASRANG
jgi:hypothetical protein